MAKTSGGRQHGNRKPEYQSYIFRVDNPEVSYSLALDRNGWAEGPYREHLELSVRGTMVVPEKLQGRQGTLTFLGDPESPMNLTILSSRVSSRSPWVRSQFGATE
jgi:hypothetical protein